MPESETSPRFCKVLVRSRLPNGFRNFAGSGGLHLIPSLPTARISPAYTGNVSPSAFNSIGLAGGNSSDCSSTMRTFEESIRWPGNWPAEACRKYASPASDAAPTPPPVPARENSGQSTNYTVALSTSALISTEFPPASTAEMPQDHLRCGRTMLVTGQEQLVAHGAIRRNQVFPRPRHSVHHLVIFGNVGVQYSECADNFAADIRQQRVFDFVSRRRITSRISRES